MRNKISSLLAIIYFSLNQLPTFGQDGNPATCTCKCCSSPHSVCTCTYADVWEKTQKEKRKKEEAAREQINSTAYPMGSVQTPQKRSSSGGFGAYEEAAKTLERQANNTKCPERANYLRKAAKQMRSGDIPSAINPPPCTADDNNPAATAEGQRVVGEQGKTQEALNKEREIMLRDGLTRLGLDIANAFGGGSQKRFDAGMAVMQEKANDLNNQGDKQFQPKDDKGVMQGAKDSNLSTDDLGPGKEDDEEVALGKNGDAKTSEKSNWDLSSAYPDINRTDNPQKSGNSSNEGESSKLSKVATYEGFKQYYRDSNGNKVYLIQPIEFKKLRNEWAEGEEYPSTETNHYIQNSKKEKIWLEMEIEVINFPGKGDNKPKSEDEKIGDNNRQHNKGAFQIVAMCLPCS